MIKNIKKELLISTIILFFICLILGINYFNRLKEIKTKNKLIDSMKIEIQAYENDKVGLNEELDLLSKQADAAEYNLWKRKTQELKTLTTQD